MQNNRALSHMALCVASIVTFLLEASCASAECGYHYSQETTELRGHKVLIEIYQPDGREKAPLVFMLHGSAGALHVWPGKEPAFDNFGEKSLARNCFVVFFPHYLEALGVESLFSTEEIQTRSEDLLRIASQLLHEAETLSIVRGSPVFLFGKSLGGYLSVALALRHAEVSALSECSGGLAPSSFHPQKHLPPLLISHGGSDRNVPVAEGQKLAAYWRRHGGLVVEHYYPGQNHYLAPETELDILMQTVRFFEEVTALPRERPALGTER